MSTITSGTEGADALLQILKDAVAGIAAELKLNYAPLIVWSRMTETDSPEQTQLWFTAVDTVEEDYLRSIGRRGLHLVSGNLLVSVFIPQAFAALQKMGFGMAERIKRAYYDQRLLQMSILNSPHAIGEPIDAWNRIDLLIVYRYNYND